MWFQVHAPQLASESVSKPRAKEVSKPRAKGAPFKGGHAVINYTTLLAAPVVFGCPTEAGINLPTLNWFGF